MRSLRVSLPVQVVLATALASALAACGSSAGHAPTTPTEEAELDLSSRSFGEACAATYGAADDITVVVLPWSNDLMVGLVLPGDGWEGACSEDPSDLLAVTDAATTRMATVTVDPEAVGDLNVEEYAREQLTRATEAMNAQGVELAASPVQHLSEGIYVVTFRMTTPDGAALFQLHAYHVIPTDHGLLRYHLSELNPDPAVLNAHAPTLLNAVRAFEIARP